MAIVRFFYLLALPVWVGEIRGFSLMRCGRSVGVGEAFAGKE